MGLLAPPSRAIRRRPSNSAHDGPGTSAQSSAPSAVVTRARMSERLGDLEDLLPRRTGHQHDPDVVAM